MRRCSDRRRYLKSLIEEHQQACNEPTVAARVAGSLILAGRLQQHLRCLSNPELADVMLEFVWGRLDSLSPECTITAEVVHRLGNSAHSRRFNPLALAQY
jgi:hypothetical protein